MTAILRSYLVVASPMPVTDRPPCTTPLARTNFALAAVHAITDAPVHPAQAPIPDALTPAPVFAWSIHSRHALVAKDILRTVHVITTHTATLHPHRH